jgi:hypothetical protein
MMEENLRQWAGILSLRIDPFFKLFAHFEKGELFLGYKHIGTRLGVASHIGLIAFHKPATESADFNSIAFNHRLKKRIENGVHELFGLFLGQVRFACQRFNKFGLGHGASKWKKKGE